MAAPLHRLSFEPVDRYLAVRYGADRIASAPAAWYGYEPPAETETVAHVDDAGRVYVVRYLSSGQVARLLGPIPGTGRRPAGAVRDRTVDRWRNDGVSVWLADRIATALALTPDDRQLWGIAWADAVDSTVDRWISAGPRAKDPPPVSPDRPARPRRKAVAA